MKNTRNNGALALNLLMRQCIPERKKFIEHRLSAPFKVVSCNGLLINNKDKESRRRILSNSAYSANVRHESLFHRYLNRPNPSKNKSFLDRASPSGGY